MQGRPAFDAVQDARIQRADAPPIVAELVAIIGEAGYLQLASETGGASFYVPRSPGADHIITRALGPKLAALVGEYFYGQTLVLPVKEWRRRSILALAETHSGDEIAAKLRISRSYVYDVLAGARRHQQPGLFD